MTQRCREDGVTTIQLPLYHPRDTSPPLTLTFGKLCRWRVPGWRLFVSSGEGKAMRNRGEKIFFFPCFARPGEEKDPQCLQTGTVSAPFFFFNEQCIKRRRFGQNASFHLKEKAAKCVRVHISPQFVICSIASLIAILIVINSITSLSNSIAGLEVGCLFQIGHWS